jgi:hypothetical protein
MLGLKPLTVRNFKERFMWSSGKQLATLVVATIAVLGIATPASAQFGGLKKRVKAQTGQEEASAQAATPGEGGTIVLTSDVVSQLLTGLKAGQAEREAAAKEDTPYGRFKTAEAAYAVAQPKCEAAQQTLPQRANPKMAEKMNALNQKMLAAQSKHDYKLMQIYQDSSMALVDPSCIVKKPEQPRDLYQAQRDIDIRAEKAEVKAAGLSAGELAMAKERAIAILQGATPPGDASASEKSAVSARAAELKPLLGMEQPAPRAMKAAPATPAVPTPAPAAAPAPDPQMSAAAQEMSACMTKNMQNHQAEIQALAKRAQAAQAAKDQAKLIAIADTVQQLQMAGCMRR